MKIPNEVKNASKALVVAGVSYSIAKIADQKLAIGHDLQYIKKAIPMLLDARRVSKNDTLADVWERTVMRCGEKICLIFTESKEKLSFIEMDEKVNQVANCMLQKMPEMQLKPGDSIGLMLENRPEFVVLTLGLSKLGLRPAFINTNNKSQALLHSLEVSKCSLLIFGEEVSSQVQDVQKDLDISSWNVDQSGGILEQSKVCSKVAPSRTLREEFGLEDVYGYIYTSGTTGLPKACIIKHSKLVLISSWSRNMYGITSDDVHYCPLPLYHTAGGVLGLSQMICNGLTLVLARKFSASGFFKDCQEHGCTTSQYIGETARYLLNSSPSQNDTKHSVRLMFGNGLRKDIWMPFVERFNIKQLGEFYGSTEGNAPLCQLFTKDESPEEAIGAVGRAGWLLKSNLKFDLVKFDHDLEMPARDQSGHCIQSGVNEPGELIGKVGPGSKVDFAGYSDEKANDKKIIRDVFEKGDAYFRTGDLLVKNESGWMYFVDRIGDTFRWKGENVSTNEVSEVFSKHSNVAEANVYGVSVPGSDGKACMTAVVLKDTAKLEDFDFKQLLADLDRNLTTYAVPMFLRFLDSMEQTGTFKQRKVDLAKDGFDISKINDPIFALDRTNSTFTLLSGENFVKISNGMSRL